MRSMRNLCEMYAKCMRKCLGLNAMVLFSVFGVFLRVIDFVDYGYAKYAKPFFAFMGVSLDLSFRFAYSHRKPIMVENCYLVCLECSNGRLYAKKLNFAYFRINQVK